MSAIGQRIGERGAISQYRTKIEQGRALVRQAVYMAALVATRFNPDMKRKYKTLIEKGKPPKLALTAIMRKLIIRDNRTWTEIRPC